MATGSRILQGLVKAGAFTAGFGATMATDHNALADSILRNIPGSTVALARRENAEQLDKCDMEEIDFHEAVTFASAQEGKGKAGAVIDENSENEIYANISRVPPSKSEVDGALETIAARPAILDHLVPRQVYSDPEKLDHLLRAVRSIVSDPALINATRLRIQAHAGEEDTATRADDLDDNNNNDEEPISPSDPLPLALKQWEEIREKYPCVICQDVLSAPCILNCSHSFCGRCINEMMGACQPVEGESSGVSVVYECPCCKTEITNFTFERILDEDISKHVENVADCAPKEAWTERREFSAMQMKKAQARRNREQRNMDDRGEDERGDVDEEGEPWRELVADWGPPLTFLVLVLIVVCRSR